MAETAGTATITVTRNSGSVTSEVNYATGAGSAVAGTNYKPVSGILVFTPGQTTKTFSIPVLNDFQISGPLTVGLALTSPEGGIVGPQGAALLTINDVVLPGALQFGSSTLTVGPTAGVSTVTVLRAGELWGRFPSPTPPVVAPPYPAPITHPSRVFLPSPRRDEPDHRGSDPEQPRGGHADVRTDLEQPDRRRNPRKPEHLDGHDQQHIESERRGADGHRPALDQQRRGDHRHRLELQRSARPHEGRIRAELWKRRPDGGAGSHLRHPG